MSEILKLKQMALDVYNKVPATQFSAKEVEEALRKEIRAMVYNEAGKIDFYKYQQNKYLIFQLISETIDEILPQRVEQTLDRFVETRTFGQGEKARFKVNKGKGRVKNFVTKVGAGGNYEVAQLDSTYVDMAIEARGGGVLVEFERFLDGTDSLTDLYDALIDGIEYRIYMYIQTALKATTSSMPAANYKTHAGFDSTKMKALITTISAYGIPNLFCTLDFAASVTPDTNFIGDADKADVRNQGYVGRYYSANLILLPTSFTDETNTTKVLDPQYGYVIPTGEERIIKLGFEGQTIIDEVKNADMSLEYQVYRKFGIVILHKNQYGIYKNTAIS
jgi:hypothetical protein